MSQKQADEFFGVVEDAHRSGLTCIHGNEDSMEKDLQAAMRRLAADLREGTGGDVEVAAFGTATTSALLVVGTPEQLRPASP